MPTNKIKISWDATPTDFVTTNLQSLTSGYVWNSGAIADATPSSEWVRISYALVAAEAASLGDSYVFRLSQGDGASSDEIWAGGLSESEGVISTAGPAMAIQSNCPIVYEVPFRTNLAVDGYQGTFDVFLPGPRWQLLCWANGPALTTGNVLRYRYGTPQVQASV
jgi:hypothetical protein